MPAGIVRAEGRIEATQVDVSSKYAGEVADVAAQEGEKVSSGQVVARLRSPDLEAQLRAAESELGSAKEAGAQDAVKAAEAKVEKIKAMIGALTLLAPRVGKVQYQLVHAGDSVAAGAPIVTLIDLADVYMSVYLPAADAHKLGMGDEARIILDRAPDYVVPATVGFVAPDAEAAPKAFSKLMLRVDLKVDPKVVQTYYGKVETGLRGAGFVRTKPDVKWPADLQVKLPPAPVAQEPKPVAQEPTPAPAPLAQAASPASAPVGGASTPSAPAAKAPASEPATQTARVGAEAPAAAAPAPAAEAARAGAPPSPPAPAQATVAPKPTPVPQQAPPTQREAKLAPPSPPVPAPPSARAPAHAPTGRASLSTGLGFAPAAEFAPESLAQLAGAWAGSAADCKKIFERRGKTLSFRQPVDRFARAVIIESQRIRLPTGVCQLERASKQGGALKVSGDCQDSISYTSATAYVKLRSKNQIVFNPNGDSVLDTSMMRCPL